MSLIPGGRSFGDRAVEDGGEEGSLETKGAFSSTWRVSSDSTRSEIETKSSSSDNEIFLPRRRSTLEWTVRGWQLRQSRTVATVRGVSRLLSNSFFLSDQWTMRMMIEQLKDPVVEVTTTEWPSGRSDHDRVTWWSEWPRPLFNPIRTRVYSWMPSRLVWKKCLSFTFISPKEKFPSKFW